jgi:hypothetical protein
MSDVLPAITRKKIGRPRKTLADLPPNWFQIVIDLSDQGKSREQILSQMCRVGKSFSIDLWDALKEREQEFSRALQIGRVLAQAWWENQGQDNLKNREFNTGLWYANMKNRFGWRDQQPDKVPDQLINQELTFADIPSNGDGKHRFAEYLHK